MTRRWAAGALVALGCAGAATACTSQDGSAPALRDVRALLARHTAHVRTHDRAAFLSDLAPGDRFRGFRDRQSAALDNLAKLPLAAVAYSVTRRTDSREAERTASKRYGSAAIIVRVQLSYQLRGIDPRPSSHDLFWTFLRRNGRVVVAGDTDLRDYGGISWQGPWDFGPLQVVQGAASLVIGHAGSAVPLQTIASVTDAAVPAVTAVWGSAWARRVAVLAPASAAELSAESGKDTATGGRTESPGTGDAAFAVSDGADPVTGVVTGQRLIVDPFVLQRLSAAGAGIVFRHEITHIAAAHATTDLSPTWVVEGFADYVGNRGSGQPTRVVASELAAAVRRGRVPPQLPSSADFAAPSTAAVSYEGAWLACRLIAEQAGQAGLVRFYRVAGAPSTGASDPTAAALRAVVHLTPAQFTARWRAYLRAQLGA